LKDFDQSASRVWPTQALSKGMDGIDAAMRADDRSCHARHASEVKLSAA
jgi:hypothetical protein